MPCKCVECGARVDCDSIICADCLAEIIDRVNARSEKDKGNDGVQAARVEQSL